jgi:hypothetical protein
VESVVRVYHHGIICTYWGWLTDPCVKYVGKRRLQPTCEWEALATLRHTFVGLFLLDPSGTSLKGQIPHNVAYNLRGTKGLSTVTRDRKGSNPLSFLFYSTTMETKIRICFWLKGSEKEETNLVLNSVCLTMNHSIVTEYCVTGDVSPQFLLTELPLTNQLPPRNRVLRNLTSPQAVKFPAYMESGSSLSHSRKPATSAYSEPGQSSPSPYSISWRNILILTSHLLCVPSALFTSSFTTLFCMHRSSRSACYTSHPCHNYWFDNPNNIWRIVLIADRCCFSTPLLFRASVALISHLASNCGTQPTFLP